MPFCIYGFLIFNQANAGSIIVKAKTKDVLGLLSSLKQQWNSFSIAAPFAYTFMDEGFAETYRAEQKVGRILGTPTLCRCFPAIF